MRVWNSLLNSFSRILYCSLCHNIDLTSCDNVHSFFHFFSWKYDVNITRIESRIKQNRSIFDFFVDFHGQVGDTNIDALLRQLQGMTDKLLVLDEKEVRSEEHRCIIISRIASCAVYSSWLSDNHLIPCSNDVYSSMTTSSRCTGSHVTSPNLI